MLSDAKQILPVSAILGNYIWEMVPRYFALFHLHGLLNDVFYSMSVVSWVISSLRVRIEGISLLSES